MKHPMGDLIRCFFSKKVLFVLGAGYFLFFLSSCEPPSTPKSTLFCQKTKRGYQDGAFQKGKNKADHFWAQGGGCVFRDFNQVVQIVQLKSFMHFSEVTRSKKTVIHPPKPFMAWYQMDYLVKNPFPLPSVQWRMDWKHKLETQKYFSRALKTEKTIRWHISYEKTKGTSYIAFWKGWILIEKLSKKVTSFGTYNEIQGSRQSETSAQETIVDFLKKARTLKTASSHKK